MMRPFPSSPNCIPNTHVTPMAGHEPPVDARAYHSQGRARRMPPSPVVMPGAAPFLSGGGFELAALDEAAETPEEVHRGVRARGGLGVVLDGERAEVVGGDALVRVVVEVHVRGAEAGALERLHVDGEAVVLRR